MKEHCETLASPLYLKLGLVSGLMVTDYASAPSMAGQLKFREFTPAAFVTVSISTLARGSVSFTTDVETTMLSTLKRVVFIFAEFSVETLILVAGVAPSIRNERTVHFLLAAVVCAGKFSVVSTPPITVPPPSAVISIVPSVLSKRRSFIVRVTVVSPLRLERAGSWNHP